jgi:anti-anti-sigma regulatory factor
VTYRIQRSTKAEAILFAVSGEMASELVKHLQELLATEGHDRILLDLKEVTFADREAVEFLAHAEATGIGIVNCPDYVRRWIAEKAERLPAFIRDRDKEKP